MYNTYDEIHISSLLVVGIFEAPTWQNECCTRTELAATLRCSSDMPIRLLYLFIYFLEVVFLLLENTESVFLFFVHSRFFLWLLSEEIGLHTLLTKSQNWVKTINKNNFNNFLIAALYFFKNCQFLHPHLNPHPNPETHPYFIGWNPRLQSKPFPLNFKVKTETHKCFLKFCHSLLLVKETF